MSESNQVEELLTDDSFVAWIESEESEHEAQKWEMWLEEDPARKKLVEAAKSLHEDMSLQKNQRPEVEAELSKLNDSIERHERSGETKAKITPLGRVQPYASIAAVMALLVTIVGVMAFYQPGIFEDDSPQPKQEAEFLTASTSDGQQKVLTLYDGSKITLNANSSIRYPSTYKGGDLSVELKGEAYFDIERKTGGQKRTFSVNIPGATVEVLGTEFNINSYGPEAKIILVEGSVNVFMRDSARNEGASEIMQPGQLATLSRASGRISMQDVNADLHTAWLQDKLVFDRTPLQTVAERIGNIYNVEFQLNDKQMEEIIVSGSLPNNNLKVFLNALEKLLDRRIINEDGVIVFGEKL